MIVAGDEMGRTQGGNNNAYCQDNEISWLDWSDVQENSILLDFTAAAVEAAPRAPGLPPPPLLPGPADRAAPAASTTSSG